jgi:hypothetical protein
MQFTGLRMRSGRVRRADGRSCTLLGQLAHRVHASDSPALQTAHGPSGMRSRMG